MLQYPSIDDASRAYLRSLETEGQRWRLVREAKQARKDATSARKARVSAGGLLAWLRSTLFRQREAVPDPSCGYPSGR